MPDLNSYLENKRTSLLRRRAAIDGGTQGIQKITTHAHAEGSSGVRRIRIRDFQIISDSPPSFAGYDLGPSSPEILLGALSSCIVHTWLIHAADQNVPLTDISVDVTGQLDPRAGRPEFDEIPVYPHEITYKVTVISQASHCAIDRVDVAVRRFCPVLNLLNRATKIAGEVVLNPPANAA